MPTGFLVLLAVAVISSVLAHWQIRRFWVAVMVSVPVTTVIFMVVTIAQAGFPNSFKPIVLVYFSGFALLVSAQVGAAFVLARHRQQELA